MNLKMTIFSLTLPDLKIHFEKVLKKDYSFPVSFKFTLPACLNDIITFALKMIPLLSEASPFLTVGEIAREFNYC